MQLLVSSRPRSTWVWAADFAELAQLQDILAAAGCVCYLVIPRTGGKPPAPALDIDIGVVALDALTSLIDAGYTLRWHETQSELNRRGNLYGAPVTG